MKLALIWALIFAPLHFSQAKLLDKTVAVFDGDVITLSQIQRVKTTLQARKNIAPQIYTKQSLSDREAIDAVLNSKIIRDKLTAMGYVISDDQVESQIKETEKRHGLTRNDLNNFLNSNGLFFEEYFEITREAIEYNIFFSRVIAPLISITEQEIKNEYYKLNQANKTLAFKFDLVDFSINRQEVAPATLKRMKDILTVFQVEGNLPDELRNLQTIDITEVKEDGLMKDILKEVKVTEEGSFTNPILIGDAYHVFYIKKKDLVESELFLKEKDQIKAKLFERYSGQLATSWFEREISRHFVKFFL